MKHQQDAGRYRQWERCRRARFNQLLQELATMLPEYETAGKDRGNTALKWSKAEVVERAVAHINELQAGKGADKKTKATRKENEWLREAIRSELQLSISREEIKSMSLEQIKQSIAKRKSESASQSGNAVRADGADGGGLGSDVFVASIGVADDHCYSMRARPDFDIVAHEEEVGEVIEEVETEDQGHNAETPDLVDNSEPKRKEKPKSVVEPRQMGSQSNAPHPQPPPATSSTVVQASSVIPTPIVVQGSTSGGFAFIPAMPFLLPAAAAGQLIIRPRLPPANKLPLPRLGASSNLRTVSVLGTTPKPSIIMPPKPKRKRRKRKRVQDEQTSDGACKKRKEQQEPEQEQEKQTVEEQPPPIIEEANGSPEAEPAKEISSTPSGETFTFPDLTKVDSILPDAILASEDPMAEEDEEEVEEELVETIDLTAEDDQHQQEGNDSERDTTTEKQSDAKVVAEMEKPTKRTSTCKEKKSTIGTGGRSKKSKSSYSIAALCQISVNIGAAASGGSGNSTAAVGVADSPGVLSLAEGSVGTVSPTITPVPTGSPLPQQQQPQPQQSQQPEQQSNQALTLSVPPPTVDELESLSPSKSFLTSFPLVSSSSSSTAKLAGIDSVEEQALETLDAEIKKLNKTVGKEVSKKTIPDLSVFDFTDGRPDSPTVPSVAPTSQNNKKTPSRQLTTQQASLPAAVTTKVASAKPVDRPKDVTAATKQSHQQVDKNVQRVESQQTPKSTASDKRTVQESRRVEKTSYSLPTTLSSASHGSSTSSSGCNPTLPPLTHHYDAGYRPSNPVGYHHHYYPSLAAAPVMSPSHFHHQGSAVAPQASNFADLAPPPPSATHGSYHASAHHSHSHGGVGGRYHTQTPAYAAAIGHHHSSVTQPTQEYHHSAPGDPTARQSSTYYSASSGRHYQYSTNTESTLPYVGGQIPAPDVNIKSGDRKNRPYDHGSRSKQGQVHPSHLPQEVLQQESCHVIQNDQGKTFSVTHLVNSKHPHQLDQHGNVIIPSKKSTKKSQQQLPTTTKTGKTSSGRSQQDGKDSSKSSVDHGKDELKRHQQLNKLPRGSTSSSSSRSHKSKSSSYSAELLVSSSSSITTASSSTNFPNLLGPAGVMEAPPMYDMGLDRLSQQQQAPSMPPPPPPPQAYPPPPHHFAWNDPPSSTPLPFPAMSPSPATLFGAPAVGGEVGTFDFSAALFPGHEAVAVATTNQSAAVVAGNRQYGGVSGGHGGQQPPNQQQQVQQQQPVAPQNHKSRPQVASNSHRQQQHLPPPQSNSQHSRHLPTSTAPPLAPQPGQHDYLSASIFDGSQLLPLPTITPPIGSEDSMPPYGVGGTFGSSSTGGGSAYPTRHSPYKKGSEHQHPQMQQQQQQQQQVIFPHHHPSQMSSVTALPVSNFHLSSILPEMNVHSKLMVAPPPPPPSTTAGGVVGSSKQHQQHQQLISGAKDSAAASSSTTKSTNPRHLNTADVPIGNHGQQVSLGPGFPAPASVPPPAAPPPPATSSAGFSFNAP